MIPFTRSVNSVSKVAVGAILVVDPIEGGGGITGGGIGGAVGGGLRAGGFSDFSGLSSLSLSDLLANVLGTSAESSDVV